MLAALSLSILAAGCASLDERLASPDAVVRREAYAEVLDTACKSGKWEEVASMLDRISDQDDLEKVLYEQSHEVRLQDQRRGSGCRLIPKNYRPAIFDFFDPTDVGKIATGNGNANGQFSISPEVAWGQWRISLARCLPCNARFSMT